MTTDLSRRTFLVVAGSAATLPAAALAAPARASADQEHLSDDAFRALFDEWKQLYFADYADATEAEAERGVRRYAEMCDHIISLTATTELQFAIQYFVAIDGGDSYPAGLFEQKMFTLVGGGGRKRRNSPSLAEECAPC